jgi:hypothetical protein
LHDLEKRLGSGDRKDEKKKKKHLQVRVRVRKPERVGTYSTDKLFISPVCYGSVRCGIWAHLARLASLARAGTPLLDYKRGVPV